MTDILMTPKALTEKAPDVSSWHRFKRVFLARKIVRFGLFIFAVLVFTAIFASWIAPYDPYQQDLTNIIAKPSFAHPLGTDSIGRDTLSRVIYGSRTALIVGFGAMSISALIGISLGLIAGFLGGLPNMIIMRFTDILMPFPMIVLALLVAALLGGGIHNVILALAIAATPGYIRVMCGMTLTIKENDYILAGKSMGAGGLRMMFLHVLPNALPPIIVIMTLELGFLILSEASLSFLGIGIEPPGAAWGAMVNEGYRYLIKNPVLSFAPGGAIMLVVFTFNMLGDALRDALDPRLRGLI